MKRRDRTTGGLRQHNMFLGFPLGVYVKFGLASGEGCNSSIGRPNS